MQGKGIRVISFQEFQQSGETAWGFITCPPAVCTDHLFISWKDIPKLVKRATSKVHFAHSGTSQNSSRMMIQFEKRF